MKHILKNTWAILSAKERRRFSLLILLDIVISIVDILSLVILLWLIQFYIQPGQNTASFLPSWIADPESVLFIALFFLLFSLKNIAGYLIIKAQYAFIGKVAVRISSHNLAEYQRSGYASFVDIDSSEHVRKIGFQPFEFSQFILSGIQQVITQSCMVIITVTAIILFNARLFLLLLVILLPPVVAVFYFVRKKLTASRSHIRSSNERSFQYLLDALKGYVEGNIFNRNSFFRNRFVKFRENYSRHLFHSQGLQSLPTRIIEIFIVLGLFILIAIAQWSQDADGSFLITIGAFMAAAYKIIPGIVRIINVSGQIRTYQYSVTDLLVDHKPVEHPGSLESSLESIELSKVHFQFGSQKVLKDFDMKIGRGDFAGIEGRSGIGKTTVMNLMLGFLSPMGGEIKVNGEKFQGIELKKVWPEVAYVRQQPFLIHDTIWRNITLSEKKPDEKELAFALAASGLNELLNTLPEGLDKMIMENGKNISGGQQQRIVLARALYKNAQLFLLDEPFNELDEASEIKLLNTFKELAANGRMVVLITHDKKSLSYCNKVFTLDEA